MTNALHATSPQSQAQQEGCPECVQLKQHVQHLQMELKLQSDLLARIRTERDQYRRLLYPAVWQQFSEEELRSFAEDDTSADGQRLEEFFADLEEIAHGRKSS